MLDFFLPVLLAVAAIRSATAIPVLEPASTTPLVDGNSNLTEGLGAIDPRFNGHVAVLGRQILDTDAGLMALTKMLHRLSGYDFDSAIGPAAYVAAGYTSVSVEFRGVPGRRDIPVKYAIWGASKVGQYILHWREVRNHVFALTWDRALVGYVEFKRTPIPLSLAGSSGKDQTQDVDYVLNTQLQAAFGTHNLGNNITLGSSLLDDDRKMTLGYHVNGDMPMTKWELFANIYAQLGLIGQFPPRQRTRNACFTTPVNFPETHFVFTPTPATGVEIRNIADAAISTAFFILSRGIFFSILMRILLDEEEIGKGLIWKGDMPRPPGSEE